MEKGNKKIIRGWVSYDWANSVYNLVISSAIFPIFFEKSTTSAYKERLLSDKYGCKTKKVKGKTVYLFSPQHEENYNKLLDGEHKYFNNILSYGTHLEREVFINNENTRQTKRAKKLSRLQATCVIIMQK